MENTQKKSTPLAVSAYAKHRATHGLSGGTAKAVRKAVASGRLIRSVEVVNGKPKILDAQLADAEWQENTRPRHTQPSLYTRERSNSHEAFSGDRNHWLDNWLDSQAIAAELVSLLLARAATPAEIREHMSRFVLTM